jgi:putative transcriptional regulator
MPKCSFALLAATGFPLYDSSERRPSLMLNENIKTIRKSKGLSQEELAIRLNVVRQTISKWETGLSVPDADLLISLSEVFEIPVSTLLGETIVEAKADDLKAISEKLEVINLQLAHRKAARQKVIHWLFIALCAVIVAILATLIVLNSPYLVWDYSQPETAVIGVVFHAFEWLFVRIAPLVLIGSIVGICLTQKKVL